MTKNPVGTHKFNKDGTPVGFTFQDMGDHVLAEWLRSKGWDGSWVKVEGQVGSWNSFTTPKGDVLAIVKYKNSQPIDRWAYLKDELL